MRMLIPGLPAIVATMGRLMKTPEPITVPTMIADVWSNDSCRCGTASLMSCPEHSCHLSRTKSNHEHQ